MRAEMEAPAASAQHNVLGVCSGSSPLAGKPSAGCVIMNGSISQEQITLQGKLVSKEQIL